MPKMLFSFKNFRAPRIKSNEFMRLVQILNCSVNQPYVISSTPYLTPYVEDGMYVEIAKLVSYRKQRHLSHELETL